MNTFKQYIETYFDTGWELSPPIVNFILLHIGIVLGLATIIYKGFIQ